VPGVGGSRSRPAGRSTWTPGTVRTSLADGEMSTAPLDPLTRPVSTSTQPRMAEESRSILLVLLDYYRFSVRGSHGTFPSNSAPRPEEKNT